MLQLLPDAGPTLSDGGLVREPSRLAGGGQLKFQLRVEARQP